MVVAVAVAEVVALGGVCIAVDADLVSSSRPLQQSWFGALAVAAAVVV